jgi:hypothetical protein
MAKAITFAGDALSSAVAAVREFELSDDERDEKQQAHRLAQAATGATSLAGRDVISLPLLQGALQL